jgi:hypothetical protein
VRISINPPLLGIQACCRSSFEHSRGPVVVLRRSAPLRRVYWQHHHGKKNAGEPASITAALVVIGCGAPCRRPAFRWSCQEAPPSRLVTGIRLV